MLLSLLLALVPIVQDPPKPAPPDPEKLKAAITQLSEAFAKTDAGPRLRAIENGAAFADPEIVKWIAKGLSDKEVGVQEAAIEALRFNEHKKALDALHDRAKQKAAKENLGMYAKLLRAIGQHGDESSFELLAENPWSAQDAKVIEAKVMGLARIRKKESVKAICDMMEMGGPQKVQPFMQDIRVALWSLTGADQEGSRDLWLKWYRDHKDKLEVRPTPSNEPRELAMRWKRYWEKPGAAEEESPRRKKGEGRRGGDGTPPEKGGGTPPKEGGGTPPEKGGN